MGRTQQVLQKYKESNALSLRLNIWKGRKDKTNKNNAETKRGKLVKDFGLDLGLKSKAALKVKLLH